MVGPFGYRHFQHGRSAAVTTPRNCVFGMAAWQDAADFRFVEVAGRGRRGFWRNKVVPVEAVPDLIARHGRHGDLYSSIFLFDKDLSRYVAANRGSVSGYQGACYAHYLPFDIDSRDLAVALDTARGLCGYVIREWGGSEESIVPAFSGSKGFHIQVDARLFGTITPSKELPEVLHEVRRSVVREAGLKPNVVDLGIGDRTRLLRLPNTVHSSSHLYKVPLSLAELFGRDADAIRELAVAPRPTWLTDPSGLVPLADVEPLPEAAEVYQRCLDRRAGQVGQPESGGLTSPSAASRFLCDAEYRLYHDGVPAGYRSGVALRLASRMRAAGHDEEEAVQLVETWNYRNQPPLPGAEAARLARSAYRSRTPLRFGCGRGYDAPHTSLVYQACDFSDRKQCAHYRSFVGSAT